MRQPAQVGDEEGAKIGHSIFQHRQTVDPAAEGKALPFVRIKAAGGDDAGLDHAASQNLQPILRSADGKPAARPLAAHVPFGRGFGEGEIAGAPAKDDVIQPYDRQIVRAYRREAWFHSGENSVGAGYEKKQKN